jgi:hypothetical protein
MMKRPFSFPRIHKPFSFPEDPLLTCELKKAVSYLPFTNLQTTPKRQSQNNHINISFPRLTKNSSFDQSLHKSLSLVIYGQALSALLKGPLESYAYIQIQK